MDKKCYLNQFLISCGFKKIDKNAVTKLLLKKNSIVLVSIGLHITNILYTFADNV